MLGAIKKRHSDMLECKLVLYKYKYESMAYCRDRLGTFGLNYASNTVKINV